MFVVCFGDSGVKFVNGPGPARMRRRVVSEAKYRGSILCTMPVGVFSLQLSFSQLSFSQLYFLHSWALFSHRPSSKHHADRSNVSYCYFDLAL